MTQTPVGSSLGMASGLLALAVFFGLLGFLIWRSLKRSPDSARLVSRWVITGVVLAGMIPVVASGLAGGAIERVFAVIVALICGLAFAIIWTPSLTGMVGEWFATLYTGGNTPPESKPVYSDALSRRINGHPEDALRLIRAQLEKFPNDFAGQMLMAEIHAKDLADLQGAEVVVLRITSQSEHPPAARAFALNSLADWYLSLTKSTEDARRILELLQEALPDSEHALQAAQRLAHLPTQEQLLEPESRRPIHLPQGRRDLGLRPMRPEELIKSVPPEQEAEDLVLQLEKHPLDLDARERLARLYAGELQRLDLAVGQLEQLIACPHVAPKQVAHWLQLLADFQLRLGRDIPAAAAAFQRIIDLYPTSALAVQAQEQIMRLPTALPAQEATTIPLGQYEQYLGLKKHAH